MQDYVIFLGSFPRKAGMERKDVMEKNVGIFASQGKALGVAKKGVKCLVVGNPANTNAAILSEYAPHIPKENISALTRLDHNRARVSSSPCLHFDTSPARTHNILLTVASP